METTHHLDLRLLAQFLVVCDTRSMTIAAEKLGMSVPAVSQLVLRLEGDLHITLFERSRQGLRLTPAGAKLREHARLLLESENQTIETLRAYRERLIPQLRLHVLLSVATPLMPAIMSEFDDLVGKIDLRSGHSETYIKDFLSGDLDLLITTEEMKGVPGVEQYFLCEEKLVGIIPAATPTERRQPAFLAKNLPFVRFMRGHGRSRIIEDYLVEIGLNPPHNIECSSPGPILELVNRGLAWAITTPFSVSSLNPSAEKIAWIPLPEPVPSRKIFLLAHTGRYLDLPQRLAERCRIALSETVDEWRRLPGNAALANSVQVATSKAPSPGRAVRSGNVTCLIPVR
jgi:DNA-binding transcriptional LysR family regulator